MIACIEVCAQAQLPDGRAWVWDWWIMVTEGTVGKGDTSEKPGYFDSLHSVGQKMFSTLSGMLLGRQTEEISSDSSQKKESSGVISPVHRKIAALKNAVYDAYDRKIEEKPGASSEVRRRIAEISNCGTSDGEHCYSAYIFSVYQESTVTRPNSAKKSKLFGLRILLVRSPKGLKESKPAAPVSTMSQVLSVSDLPTGSSVLEITVSMLPADNKLEFQVDGIEIIDKGTDHWLRGHSHSKITPRSSGWQRHYTKSSPKHDAPIGSIHRILPAKTGLPIKIEELDEQLVLQIIDEVASALSLK